MAKKLLGLSKRWARDPSRPNPRWRYSIYWQSVWRDPCPHRERSEHARLRTTCRQGIGITYATTTMGADHTAGYTICPEILSVGGKVDPLVQKAKPRSAARSRQPLRLSILRATACSSPLPFWTSPAATRGWSRNVTASWAPTGRQTTWSRSVRGSCVGEGFQ